MSTGQPEKPDVVAYGDHEVITPDTSKLRKMLRPAPAGEPDPVARAERALAQIVRRVRDLDERRMRTARRRAPQGSGTTACHRKPAGAVPRRP